MSEPDEFRTESINTKLELLQNQPWEIDHQLQELLVDAYRDLQNVNNKVNQLDVRVKRLENTQEV